MLKGRKRRNSTVLKQSRTTQQPLRTGTTAMALIIAVILTVIAVPAVMADNTTATATQTTVQTTATTTVPTTTQTTSFTTVQTTATMPAQSSEIAWFSAEPVSGAAPLTVEFTDTSTGYPTSWEWYFGDGSSDYVQNPSHTYTDEGTYSVALNVVIGGTSYTAIRTDVISVHETVATTTTTTQTTTSPTVSPVVAGFSASPITGTAPLIVTFTDTSTGSPTTWDWDFGDQSSSTLENPSHTYYNPGKYTVTLVAERSDSSDEVTRTTYIIVVHPTQPATVKATVPVTSATKNPESALQAEGSSKPTAETVSAGQNGLAIPWFYILVIVVIVIIAGIGILIWRRRNWYDELG